MIVSTGYSLGSYSPVTRPPSARTVRRATRVQMQCGAPQFADVEQSHVRIPRMDANGRIVGHMTMPVAALGDFGFSLNPAKLVKGIGKGASAIGKGAVAVVKAVPKAAETVGKGTVAVVKAVAHALPSPADYDPERLIVIGLTDPAKFAVLTGAASLVVPGLGAAYMAQFLLPQAIGTGLPLAVGKAVAKGGWDRVVNNILEPIYKDLGDKAKFLVDYALNGNSAIARWGVRKVADKLGESVVKAILLAIADSAQIIDVIRNPSQLKEEGTFINLADLIQKVASSGAVGQGGFRDGALATGEVLRALAPSISIILKRGVEGVPDAIDRTAQKVLGFSPKEILALPKEAQVAIAKAKFSNENGFKLGILNGATTAIKSLADALGKLPWGVGKVFTAILGAIEKMVADVQKFLEMVKAMAANPGAMMPSTPPPLEPPPPDPSPAPPPTPVVVAPAPAPEPANTGVIPPPPDPRVAMKPSSGSRLAKMLVGAGGGALIGGPAGALIGGAAGAIL
jgi:hypothetical protein